MLCGEYSYCYSCRKKKKMTEVKETARYKEGQSRTHARLCASKDRCPRSE